MVASAAGDPDVLAGEWSELVEITERVAALAAGQA